MTSADRALDSACNWLANHPRLTAIALSALIVLACQLDRYLP